MPKRKVIVTVDQKVKIWLKATVEFTTDLTEAEITDKINAASGQYVTDLFPDAQYLESEYLVNTEEAMSRRENNADAVMEVQQIEES